MLQKKIAAIPHMVIRVMVDLMVIFLVGREEPQRAFSSNFPSRPLQIQGVKRVSDITAAAAEVCYESRYGVCCAGSFDLYLRRKKMTLKSIVQRQKKLSQFCKLM